jgi:hypothetical protein
MAPAMAEEVAQFELTGDIGMSFSVEQEELTVRVVLKQNGKELLSVGVGNAGLEPEAIEQVKFCADCDPAYFIPVYDASSTYGAITGVLAWSSGTWWSLSILPLIRPAVEDPDGDGIYALVDYIPRSNERELYDFQNGFISPR